MNSAAPTCSSCGGVNVDPQANQCRFCGRPLIAGGYGLAPQNYAPQQQQQQQAGYGGYGGPMPPAQNYGAPPAGYGGGYGGPTPNPYGGPMPNPYGNPYAPNVAPFGGYGPQVQYRSSGWASGWSTFFWVRLAIAAIAISISLIGACVSAISH